MSLRSTPAFQPLAANPAAAVVLMLMATGFIAASTLMAKIAGTDTLGPPLHPVQVVFGRFLFGLLGVGVLATLRGVGPRTANPGLHLGRAMAGAAGVTMMFAAVAAIPLGDATAISFLNPVFAMLFAIPLLGESVGRWRWTAALVAFGGALVLLRPTGTVAPGALFALAAAILLGFEVIVMKVISKREPPLKIVLINNMLGVCLSGIAVIWFWQVPSGAQILTLAGVGLFMVTAQGFYVNAVARADTSFVVPFSYATLLFAVLYDRVFFAQTPDAVSLLGAGLIIAAGVVLAWREGRAKAPPA